MNGDEICITQTSIKQTIDISTEQRTASLPALLSSVDAGDSIVGENSDSVPWNDNDDDNVNVPLVVVVVGGEDNVSFAEVVHVGDIVEGAVDRVVDGDDIVDGNVETDNANDDEDDCVDNAGNDDEFAVNDSDGIDRSSARTIINVNESVNQ